MTDVAPSGEPGSGTPEPVTFPDNWKEGLSEDLRADPTIANLQTPQQMGEMLVSSQKMIGSDKIAIPAADDADGWKAFYGKVGRPDAPEGYELAAPEGVTVNEEYKAAMQGVFHSANLTTAQAAAVAEGNQAYLAEAAKHTETKAIEAADKEVAGLHSEWGKAYDKNMEIAKQAAQEFDPTGELMDKLEAGNFMGRAAIYKMFAGIGSKITPDGQTPGEPGDSFEFTPADAQAKKAQLLGSADFKAKYWDKKHPQHAEAVQEMFRLEQAIAAAKTAVA